MKNSISILKSRLDSFRVEHTSYFRFIDAKPGAGKTHAIVEQAAADAGRGMNTIILQPTKHLLNQTAADFKQRFPNVAVDMIHGDEVESPVKSIVAYSKRDHCGSILLITHKAFELVPYFENQCDWHLVVDEILQVHAFTEMNLTRNHALITNHLEIVKVDESGYVQLIARDRNALDAIVRSGDVVDGVLRELASRILKHWKCFVKPDEYKALLNGERQKLSVYQMMTPTIFDGFASATIVGADFKESLLYKFWSGSCGRSFTEKKVDLRFDEHPNGESVTITCFTERSWSKTLRDKVVKSGSWHKVEARVREIAGEEKLLWNANNDKDDCFMFDGRDETNRLSNEPHGLNCYKTHDNVALFSAFNLESDQIKFLKAMYGIDGEQVAEAIHRQKLYQAVARGSIREPDNGRPKRIIVPSRIDAEFLQSKIAGSKVEFVDLDIADFAPQEKATRGSLYYKDLKPSDSGDFLRIKDGSRTNDSTPIRMLTLAGATPIKAFHGTIFAGVQGIRGKPHFASQLIPFLKGKARIQVANKEDVKLISPFLYDFNHRTKANALAAQWLILDYDDGTSPDQFCNAYPELDVITHTTYSHTPEHPKFRAFIPLSREVNAAEYERIARVFKDADNACKQAAAIFYLPCNGAKVVYRKGQFLNVDSILSFMPEQDQEKESFIVTPWHDPEITKSKIEEAEAECLRDAPIQGQGHRALNLYMSRLWIRLPENQVRERAEAMLPYFHNPDERRREIESNIASMKKNFGVCGAAATH